MAVPELRGSVRFLQAICTEMAVSGGRPSANAASEIADLALPRGVAQSR